MCIKTKYKLVDSYKKYYKIDEKSSEIPYVPLSFHIQIHRHYRKMTKLKDIFKDKLQYSSKIHNKNLV